VGGRHRRLDLLGAGPGGADGLGVHGAQVALEEPLVEGGHRDRADPDLEPVGQGRATGVAQPLHLPQVAELVLGAGGGP
jgi:hypothetical protein